MHKETKMSRNYLNGHTLEELAKDDAEKASYLAEQMPKFERMKESYIYWNKQQVKSVIAIVVSLVGLGIGSYFKIPWLVLTFVAAFLISGIFMLYCGKMKDELFGPL
jgi:hypothetical protein